MLGLLSAIREFSPSLGVSFQAYAQICIKHRIISAVKSASRLKHAPLNEGVSLDEMLSEDTKSVSAFSCGLFRRIPEEQVLARESTDDFISYSSRYLSKLETEILSLYLDGLSYNEIAQASGRSLKSVDNAVQRIRNKLARHLTLGDFS
jgi:RNA polymerase sporulation-specific sigma factor